MNKIQSLFLFILFFCFFAFSGLLSEKSLLISPVYADFICNGVYMSTAYVSYGPECTECTGRYICSQYSWCWGAFCTYVSTPPCTLCPDCTANPVGGDACQRSCTSDPTQNNQACTKADGISGICSNGTCVCGEDSDCLPNPNEFVKTGGCDTGAGGHQWFFQNETGVCDRVSGQCTERDAKEDCGVDADLEIYGCDGSWKTQQKQKVVCDNTTGCGDPIKVVEKTEDCGSGCVDAGEKRCSSGVLEKKVTCNTCEVSSPNTTPSTCGTRDEWVTDDTCGGCVPTGNLQCGGPYQGFPASLEHEEECSYCVGTGADSHCTTPKTKSWFPDFACGDFGSTSMYCVGKDIWQLKLTCPGGCENIPPPSCKFDCTSSLSIVSSCPYCCSGSLYTQFPGVGGPGISCYGSCVAGSTQACGKCGTQTCSSKCGWGVCQGEKSCTAGQTENCPGGGTKTCNTSCEWVPDANCQESHNACNDSQQCILVAGAGTDACQTNTDCQNSYNTCNASHQCVPVVGTGTDTCLTSDDCVGPHNICSGEQCVSSPDSGIDECTTGGDCTGPTAVNLDIPGSDHCINPPGCGVVTFEWVYQSPNNTNEKQFTLQIDDNADFSSPEVNILVGDLNNPSGTVNSQIIVVRPIPTTLGGNYLAYGETYHWRVKVWDIKNRVSTWIENPTSFPTYAHPFPAPDFSVSTQTGFNGSATASLLTVIEPNTSVTFVDNSVCYNSDETTYRCRDRALNEYTWTFGDGTTSNVRGDVAHTYAIAGTYTVNLHIVDDIGSCNFSTTIGASATTGTGGLFLWKEITPFQKVNPTLALHLNLGQGLVDQVSVCCKK